MIYRFRGADPQTLFVFQQVYSHPALIKLLSVNYRSTSNILAVAAATLQGNLQRIDKTLRAARPGHGEVVTVAQLGKSFAFVH